jgi:hypothetical protein
MYGSYIFEFSVNNDIGKKITMIKGVPGYLLAYFLTLIVIKLNISVEQSSDNNI